MNPLSLDQRQIIITGGSGALGRAVVSKAVALGAKVFSFDLANGDIDGVTYHVVDLLDSKAVSEAVANIGPVDALFNLAGGFSMGPQVQDNDSDEWQRMFAMNVDTLRNMVQAVVPGMQQAGYGKIVNVGALGALQGAAGMGSYIAAKSAVMKLTETLSEELKTQGINVNAVLPSMIDTPANRQAMPDADPSQWVATDDLANAICFLGSDAATAIHGALLPVRGLY